MNELQKFFNSQITYGIGVKSKEDNIGQLFDIIHKIERDYKPVIDNIKKMENWKHCGNKIKEDRFKAEKIKLPWLMIANNKGRTSKYLQNHYIIVDIDLEEKANGFINSKPFINENNLNILNSIPFVLFTGKSCSGTGYYSVVKFSNLITEESEFKEMFSQLEDYYKKLGFKIDESCKNINRIRFYSPYEITINHNFVGEFIPKIKIKYDYEETNSLLYNFKVDSCTSFTGEIKSGTIGNLGGNDARINVASCIKKFFPNDYIDIINSTFSSIDPQDLKEMITAVKYEQSGKYVKSIVRNWCFNNLDCFNSIKNKSNIIWGEEETELTSFLNDSTKDLIDCNFGIKDNEYLGNVIDLQSLPKKVIINSPCGSGKSYWIKNSLLKSNQNIKLFAPYKSIQSVYYKDDIKSNNIVSINNNNIKRNDIVVIDEAHLFMIDSQYRDEISEVEKVCMRKDIKIILLTGTPSIEYIKLLKDIGFKYYYFYYENAVRYKKIRLLNLSIESNKKEDILKSIKKILTNEGKYYNASLICSNKYHRKLINLGITSETKDISSDNYNKGVKEVRDFCKGDISWNGNYIMTRYGYAGIDYKGTGKYLVVVFNSEINILDLIQLVNRFRNGKVSVINVIDSNYEGNTNNKILNMFGKALIDLENWSRQNPVNKFGYLDYISIPKDIDYSNIEKYKRKALYNSTKLKYCKGDIYYNGTMIKADEEKIEDSWKRFDYKNDFCFNYAIFLNIIEQRIKLDDKTFLKYCFRYRKIKDIENKLWLYFRYKDFNKSVAMEYYYSNDIVIFGGWDKDDINSNYEDRKAKIINSFINEEKETYIQANFKEYLETIDQRDKIIIIDSIARKIIKIADSFNYGKEYEIKFINSNKSMIENIISEIGEKENDAFQNANVDDWFNEEIVVRTEKGEEVIKIHNSHLDRKGLSCKFKYVLNSDTSIKFKSRDEMYEYCKKELGYIKTRRSFDRDFKNYCSRIEYR